MSDTSFLERHGRQVLIAVLITLVLGFLLGGVGQHLNLESLKAAQAALESRRAAAPITSAALFFLAYVLMAALSLPGGLIMTLAGGAIFGFTTGLLLVSFAASIGATLAFLSARYLLRDRVEQRWGDRTSSVQQRFEREGVLYLLTLRLIPIFPFFLINLLMGLTRIRTPTFYGVSQLGMLPATAAFVNAGTQLAAIESPSDVLSPGILLAFVILGLLPWLTRAIVRVLQTRKALAGWNRPDQFDRNLIVIGAGSGGLVSAYIAAKAHARVTLIEAGEMGGDCLNTGCVPSKALLQSARVMHQARTAEHYGISVSEPQVDFAKVMRRVREVIATIAPHDSVERYEALGVEVIKGRAELSSPWTVSVNGTSLSAPRIIIATGARPFMPPIPGLDQIDALNSDTIWSLNTLPERLAILGGGPIGCELAQAFARFGSEVHLIEMAPRLLPREDADAASVVAQSLERDGVKLYTAHRAESFESPNRVHLSHAEGSTTLSFDHVLVAVGRKANTTGFGLEQLGVRLRDDGTIETDAAQRTSVPTLLAVGDVAGPWQLTHAASHQAWSAAMNALFGRFWNFHTDDRVMPRVSYTDPELAQVGLDEAQAQEQGIAYELTRYELDDLDRAIADGDTEGFIKVLTVPGKGRILGVTWVGAHAGEHMAELTLAMRHKLGLGKVLATVHPYPTMSEANKYVAGQWRSAHAPEKLMAWVARYHARQLS